MKEDRRKPIDVLLSEEGKMLERGARMLACGETGKSYSLNRVDTPEVSTTFTSRRKEFHYVAKVNGYDY